MNEIKNSSEAPVASQEGMLAAELFLRDNYRFRRNVLNGKVEYQTLPDVAPTLGDGADEQPAGEPRRVGSHPSQPACESEADALEE